MKTKEKKRDNMFLIAGTFALIVLMLIIGFIGEAIGSMFSSSDKIESALDTTTETNSQLAAA